MVNSIFYPPIGLAGHARAGKDSLGKALIEVFKTEYHIPAKRFSIAGDYIRKDLNDLIQSKTNISLYTQDDNEKTLLRPIMVEYGRLMRNTTEGRYFIEHLQGNKEFRNNNISIITDMRYTEYPKDEIFWLKNEMKGLLVYIEREGLNPANEFERINNEIIKREADVVVYTKDNINYEKLIREKAIEVIDKYFSTTFQ
jgi:hypothetical protein